MSLHPYFEFAFAVWGVRGKESKHVGNTASGINSDTSVFVIHNGGIDELLGDGGQGGSFDSFLSQSLEFSLKLL